MKIAIVGSFYNDTRDGFSYLATEAEFRAACHDLGRLLARLKHTLTVQYDDARCADKYCVEGYLSEAALDPDPQHAIIVGRPSSSLSRHFDVYAAIHEDIFTWQTFGCARWDSARFRG